MVSSFFGKWKEPLVDIAERSGWGGVGTGRIIENAGHIGELLLWDGPKERAAIFDEIYGRHKLAFAFYAPIIAVAALESEHRQRPTKVEVAERVKDILGQSRMAAYNAIHASATWGFITQIDDDDRGTVLALFGDQITRYLAVEKRLAEHQLALTRRLQGLVP